jgi:hypothetical protein
LIIFNNLLSVLDVILLRYANWP